VLDDIKSKDEPWGIYIRCSDDPEVAEAGSTCGRGIWAKGPDEETALRTALGLMVQEVDPNLKTRAEQRDRIVEALFRQLQRKVV